MAYIADKEAYDLTFTSCGTEADDTAVFGYARRGNAVTSAGEHSAILSPFAELKNRGIAEPRYAPLKKDGSVDEEKLLALVDEKTSFVSVMHVNNETGAINDVNEIAKRVKAKIRARCFTATACRRTEKFLSEFLRSSICIR